MKTIKTAQQQAKQILKILDIKQPNDEQVEIALSFISTALMLEAERVGSH